MDKSPDAFRTISEVAEWLGVQAHVLRFWESKFAQVKPVKRAGGRRYYRPADMLLLGGIKKLLHEDGLTVKGTQKILREQGVAHVSDLSQELCDVAADTAQKMAEDAKVVPFKGDPAPAGIKDITPPEVSSRPEVATPEVTAPPEVAAPPEVTPPEGIAQPAAQAKTPAVDVELELERPELPPKAPTSEEPEEEQPILPSFLHRPAAVSAPKSPAEMPPETPTEAPTEAPTELPLESPTEAPAESPPETQPESQPEIPPEAVAEAKPSLVVDAPDPADESDIPYTRATLAHLSRVQSLNAAQAAQIAPLAKELQGWLDRTRGAGAS